MILRPAGDAGLAGDDAFGQHEQARAGLVGARNQILDDGEIFFARFLHEELGECDFDAAHRRNSSGKSLSAVLRWSVRPCSKASRQKSSTILLLASKP